MRELKQEGIFQKKAVSIYERVTHRRGELCGPMGLKQNAHRLRIGRWIFAFFLLILQVINDDDDCAHGRLYTYAFAAWVSHGGWITQPRARDSRGRESRVIHRRAGVAIVVPIHFTRFTG